ncbi:uncharacterized protein [Euwallacea fornicatus]|uniref:uncharacterized protein isoform X2 n=1 Tax=Euwallacea fornicatus TaxID=995702 RepID=UPI00338E4E6B
MLKNALLLRSIKPIILLFFLVGIKAEKQQQKSRQKRILWVTEDGRLALPPGTTMIIAPSLSMPFVRHPPKGFFSNLTVSLPFTIDFDKLGLTDNENPFGDVPPLLARSMGRTAGGIFADYIGDMLNRRRVKRSPPKTSGHFQGGERALLYVAIEELLENFGMDGRACLLRAICEVHAYPLGGFGLLGEMLKLFLSASQSPYAHLMQDHVNAERAGRGLEGGAGECWPYMKDCPKSLFMNKHNRYSHDDDEGEEINEVAPVEEVMYNPSRASM